MFGMTKKQFLKKSKNCTKETGIQLLNLRDIFIKEQNGKLSVEDAHRRLENVRKNMENIFFKYEKLKPPSKCKGLQRKILNNLIILQGAIVLNLEYLISIKEHSKNEDVKKYKESLEELDKFKEQFHIITREVDKYL